MQTDRFYGTYMRFNTISKREGALLLGADNLIGDAFDIVFETKEGIITAWLENRFHARVGFFDTSFSRALSLFAAREWSLRAVLSLVAYTDYPAPGYYWGEVAVLCYDTKWEHAFDSFVVSVGNRLSKGFRPKIDLGEQGVAQIIDSDGLWMPKLTVPKPQEDEKTAFLKDHRKLTEVLIEQGRKGNKGCYVLSWVFLLAIAAAIILVLKLCGLF